MDDDTRLSYRLFGTPGARRLVLLAGTGMAVAADPSPVETRTYDLRVLAVDVDPAAVADPGAYGSRTPAEQTADVLVAFVEEALADDETDEQMSAALVAYRDTADVVVRAAAALGERVDRLVLVAVAPPPEPLDRDDLAVVLAEVSAQTLILNGRHDEPASTAAAEWFRDHMPSARVETVAGAEAVGLPSVWSRVLAHSAPGSER